MDDLICDGNFFFHFRFKLDPVGISLSRSFGAIVRRQAIITEADRLRNLYGGLSQVVLVVAQSHRITEVSVYHNHTEFNKMSKKSN